MMAKPIVAQSPAKQVAGFIAKFDPAIAKLTRSCRSVIRKRYPAANELVYDNYNALAIGYSPTERTSDVVFSLAVYARGVNLYFMYGIALDDPHHLLLGSGNQGRFVRLESAAILDRPEIKDLLDMAIAEGDTPLPPRGRGRLIIKSVMPKHRQRRS